MTSSAQFYSNSLDKAQLKVQRLIILGQQSPRGAMSLSAACDCGIS